MQIVQLCSQPRDVPLALLLKKTCPHHVTTCIVNVDSRDEFGWKKPKKMEKCLQDSDTELAMAALGDDTENVSSAGRLKDILRGADIAIGRGREFFIIKSGAKKTVALCFNRCYFTRFLDVFPKYGNDFQVMMYHKNWLDEALCGKFEMRKDQNYDQIRQNMHKFTFGNPFAYIYDLLQKEGKVAVRKRLGLPTDRPVAFLSFRFAEPAFSIHANYDEGVAATKKMIEDYKAQGYYIVSRRRIGKHDVISYKILGMPDKSRFGEVSSLVDMELDHTSHFPGEIWESLFAADVALLADISGIAYIEMAMMRTPVIMPHKGVLPKREDVCPAVRDMFDRGLMMNHDTSETREIYRLRIGAFLEQWFHGGIDDFWKEVLK